MQLPEPPASPAAVARRSRSAPERAFASLTSPKLAIALLVAVLACCVVGVTLFRGALAWQAIFSTLWFNALLVLLALSSAAAFFSRIWRRRLTLVSVGMIVFHVSFAGLLGGVVFNSLFHFSGILRLTEGETLPNGAPESYDGFECGRLFDLRRLRGETTLVKMHSKYLVDGQDKRATYDVEIVDGAGKAAGTIYVNQAFEHDGVRYLRGKEGYSVLVVMSDKGGTELFGAYVPLQSMKRPEGGYLYATGTATEPKGFPFPPPPDAPRAELLVSYRPSTVEERAGETTFQVVPLGAHGESGAERGGRVIVGAPFDAGDVTFTAKEIRYWVGMDVRYDPGQTFILGTLCAGLCGMVLILIGRLRQGSPGRRDAPTLAVTSAAPRQETA